jgi:hypothetical protein
VDCASPVIAIVPTHLFLRKKQTVKLAFAFALILIPSVILQAEDPPRSIRKNVQELWADYEALDESTPLEVEVLKE